MGAMGISSQRTRNLFAMSRASVHDISAVNRDGIMTTRNRSAPSGVDHNGRPGKRFQLACQSFELRGASVHEGRPQQQVFRRVARQGQFRCDHLHRALCMGLPRGVDNPARVAG
jgi:hypothetical protein